jgi:AcrR family transcriptional regulator
VFVTRERPTTRRSTSLGGAGRRGGAPISHVGVSALREVALRRFVASGYHAVSIRDLAREAGVTLSVLYHHYGSKQELLYQLLDAAVDSFHRIHQQRTQAVDPAEDPVLRYLLLIDAIVRYRALLPNESLLFIREFRNLETQFAERLAHRRNTVATLFSDAITAGVDSGAFSTPFPDDARRSLLATLNSIPNWYRDGGDITVDVLVRRYQRLALVIVEFTGNIPDAIDSTPSSSPLGDNHD